jgi:hypothetical protein
MAELKILGKEGMVVTCDDGTLVKSKVHMLLATGDIPAAGVSAGHIGHTALYGCRICAIQGVPGVSGYGKYFKPTPENLDLQWRSSLVFLENGLQVTQ